jgi:hypothetical protein
VIGALVGAAVRVLTPLVLGLLCALLLQPRLLAFALLIVAYVSGVAVGDRAGRVISECTHAQGAPADAPQTKWGHTNGRH